MAFDTPRSPEDPKSLDISKCRSKKNPKAFDIPMGPEDPKGFGHLKWLVNEKPKAIWQQKAKTCLNDITDFDPKSLWTKSV